MKSFWDEEPKSQPPLFSEADNIELKSPRKSQASLKEWPKDAKLDQKRVSLSSMRSINTREQPRAIKGILVHEARNGVSHVRINPNRLNINTILVSQVNLTFILYRRKFQPSWETHSKQKWLKSSRQNFSFGQEENIRPMRPDQSPQSTISLRLMGQLWARHPGRRNTINIIEKPIFTIWFFHESEGQGRWKFHPSFL